MKRRLLTPDDTRHYRWLLGLDSSFSEPNLPRGFDYEAHIDEILEMIWSPRMTNILGIELDRFLAITKTDIIQQKRDLLDIALTFGPIQLSRSLLSATDILLQAENTGHQPLRVRPPALRSLPVRLEAFEGIEIWCGAAAALRSDVALVLADIDLSFQRLQPSGETSIRAHSIAGPRLRSDCSQLKQLFDADFQPGTTALTRGYFSGARYFVHAVPPCADNGIWKHTVAELNRCYASLWEFATKLKAARIAVEVIYLGKDPALEAIALETLVEQASCFQAAQKLAPTICLVGPTTAIGVKLANAVRSYRLEARFLPEGGFLPAGNPATRFSPGSLGEKNAIGFTDKALAKRSSISTVGFSKPRSSRLT